MLGRGGQGVVYLARDTMLNRLVALKFLPPALVDNECAQQRFVREARTAAAVRHPNICTVYAIETTEEGQPFIAMSYYEGVTLRSALNDGVLSISEAIEIAAQIAEGLSAAHAQGVVHRDVKPGNVMLTDQGVRILDFGLARFIDSSPITAAGSVLGTASYMSPEQTRCEPADPRSDVWSLGIILYEMLTGAPPFTGSHPEAICYAIRHDRVPSLLTSALGVPKTLRSIILRALTKNPARRPTAYALARALRSLQMPDRASGTLSALVRSPNAWRGFAATFTPAYTALVTAASDAVHALKSSTQRIRSLN